MAKKDIEVDLDFSGNKLLNKGEESISSSAILNAPSFAVNQNNYAPVGIENCSILRITSSLNNLNITGIVAPNTARCKQMMIFNVGTNTIIFSSNSASSLAPNRILLANNSNISVRTNGCAIFIYDQTSQRWRVSHLI